MPSPAGELVRVAAGVLGRQADELQQLLHPRPRLLAVHPAVGAQASPIARSIVLRGLSEAYRSWNTIWALTELDQRRRR